MRMEKMRVVMMRKRTGGRMDRVEKRRKKRENRRNRRVWKGKE